MDADKGPFKDFASGHLTGPYQPCIETPQLLLQSLPHNLDLPHQHLHSSSIPASCGSPQFAKRDRIYCSRLGAHSRDHRFLPSKHVVDSATSKKLDCRSVAQLSATLHPAAMPAHLLNMLSNLIVLALLSISSLTSSPAHAAPIEDRSVTLTSLVGDVVCPKGAKLFRVHNGAFVPVSSENHLAEARTTMAESLQSSRAAHPRLCRLELHWQLPGPILARLRCHFDHRSAQHARLNPLLFSPWLVTDRAPERQRRLDKPLGRLAVVRVPVVLAARLARRRRHDRSQRARLFERIGARRRRADRVGDDRVRERHGDRREHL